MTLYYTTIFIYYLGTGYNSEHFFLRKLQMPVEFFIRLIKNRCMLYLTTFYGSVCWRRLGQMATHCWWPWWPAKAAWRPGCRRTGAACTSTSPSRRSCLPRTTSISHTCQTPAKENGNDVNITHVSYTCIGKPGTTSISHTCQTPAKENGNDVNITHVSKTCIGKPGMTSIISRTCRILAKETREWRQYHARVEHLPRKKGNGVNITHVLNICIGKTGLMLISHACRTSA